MFAVGPGRAPPICVVSAPGGPSTSVPTRQSAGAQQAAFRLQFFAIRGPAPCPPGLVPHFSNACDGHWQQRDGKYPPVGRAAADFG